MHYLQATVLTLAILLGFWQVQGQLHLINTTLNAHLVFQQAYIADERS